MEKCFISDMQTEDEEKLPEDRNMAATIASEEALAIPNALIASEIMDAVTDALSPVVEEILGDSVVDILSELGADSLVELLVGEALNGVTGGVFGTLFGLTYSAYRCGALWIAPTVRSCVALITGMLGGLAGSTVLRYVGEIAGGTVGAFLFDGDSEGVESVDEQGERLVGSGETLGAMIVCTLFGAVGAFAGRLNAIKLSNKFMEKYFPYKTVKSKNE